MPAAYVSNIIGGLRRVPIPCMLGRRSVGVRAPSLPRRTSSVPAVSMAECDSGPNRFGSAFPHPNGRNHSVSVRKEQ